MADKLVPNNFEPKISVMQQIAFVNFKCSFFLSITIGVAATFKFFSGLETLFDKHGSWVVQASPVAYVVYLFGFNLFYILLVKHMDYSFQRFAFFSGLFSAGCLISTIVNLYVFPEIGFDVEPGFLYGLPESVFVCYFLYICASNFAYAAFWHRPQW